MELPNAFAAAEADHLAIELDLRFSPAENAARFLKRARKLEKRLQVLPERLSRVRQQEQSLRQMLAGFGDRCRRTSRGCEEMDGTS